MIEARSAINNLKSQLSSEFEIKDMGEAKRVLGIEIDRGKKSGKVRLTHKGYL